MMNQHTLKKEYTFEGKGLHTGRYSHICIKPAPAGSGISFLRTDLGVTVPAQAKYVSSTQRSTALTFDGASVMTVEHILSALTGLGVDNALIETDAEEMPILDGSAALYVEAILNDGLEEQEAERVYLEISEAMEVEDVNSGSWLRITPADAPSVDIGIDFGSKVLGVQKVHWDETVSYADQIAPCRTFCFFHELEFLVSQGLVQGGDVDNAIVVVENPVSDEQIERVSRIFDKKDIKASDSGYLNNLELHFQDECGRHKMLDILGDLRLAGGFLKAHIEAYKPGHGINTLAAKAAQSKLK